MIIQLKQPQNPDIYSFGFNKYLTRNIVEIQSDNQLDLLEDKINRIVQSGDTITSLVPGLLETEYNGL